MRKRVLSCLLAALLLFGAAAAPQQALAAGAVEISSVSGAKGEVVEVSVSLKSDDVYSGNFNIRYDSGTLALVSARAEKLPSVYCLANDTGAGVVRVTFTGTAEPIRDAVLCTLTFRIRDDTPPDGSAVSVEQLRLYTGNGEPTDASAVAGSVAKKVAHLSLSSSKTAEYQAVGVTVRLDGGLRTAGGNFTFTYDPNCLEVRSVQALDGLNNAPMTYRVEKPGMLRVSFGAAKALPDGELCTVILQTVTAEPKDSAVNLTDVRLYDENSAPLDTAVTNGTVSVTVPSDRDPKLWIVGGALQEDGTAKVAVVFQGRGVACGGNFELLFNSSMKATVESHDAACVVGTEEGRIRVSWGSVLPCDDEQQLVVVSFANAADGQALTFDGVRVYDKERDIVAEVRPTTIEKHDSVTAVVDEKKCSVDESTSGKRYTVAVDVADMQRFSGHAVSSVTPMLALYQGTRLVGLTLAEKSNLSSGVGELSLSAESKENVTFMRVFLVETGGGYSPLCAALNAPVQK